MLREKRDKRGKVRGSGLTALIALIAHLQRSENTMPDYLSWGRDIVRRPGILLSR
jgi:hypothetical protein